MPRGLLDFARRIRHLKQPDRYWGYIHWLKANYPYDLGLYLWKHYERNKLCPHCGGHIANWREVFGEEHICEVRL